MISQIVLKVAAACSKAMILLLFIHGLFSLVLFDLVLYIPVNNLSVMSGKVFLGWTSTNQRIKCLAQVHNAVPLVRLKPTTS